MSRERIPIAADHAGYELKTKLRAELERLGYDADDLGTHSPASTDYADYAHPLAQEIADGTAQRGILLCGTGLGMAYVANRYPGVRAALVWSEEVSHLSRSHNDANVLVLPARFLSEEVGVKILHAWLDTKFEGGRHQARVDKIERDDDRGGDGELDVLATEIVA